MRALIVEDEPLARNELSYLLTEIRPFEAIDEADSIQTAIEALLCHTFDVVFIDINLMDESGLDLATKIKQMDHPPHVIFATAHHAFAVKAFELNATDYILKPFEQQRIAQALQKVEQQPIYHEAKSQNESSTIAQETTEAASSKQTPVLPVEENERIHLIHFNEIIAIAVNQGTTTIYTTDRTFETTEPLSHYESRLKQHDLIRIHRATLVNINHIQTIEPWFNYTYQLTMTDGLKFQVSRSYMKAFKQQFHLS
ncbi:response regulator transcription factor LytR [Staphylococcus auricularis]|uniref:response regulator transcription factor LytR n=1 Tax=Staphylococcus auricularis TaxID=29379 RepID=UPI003EC02505